MICVVVGIKASLKTKNHVSVTDSGQHTLRDSTVVPRNIVDLKMTLNREENGYTETTSTSIFIMYSILYIQKIFVCACP